MPLTWVHRATIPPHIFEIIFTHSTWKVPRGYSNVYRRHFVASSAASGVLSKFSSLIHTDQQLKPTDAEAEEHNRHLSILRSALSTQKIVDVQEAYYALARHQSEAAIMSRDFEEISRILDRHFSTCSTPRDALVGTVEMALQAAARGHHAGLKTCLHLHLTVGDSHGILSLYDRFHKLGQVNHAEKWKRTTIARPAEALGDIQDDSNHSPSNPDMVDIVLIMVVAHAMEDKFDDALDYFLATPMAVRLVTSKVYAFCRAYLPHDVPLSDKVLKWAEELVFFRLISKESSLNGYISDLGDDKRCSRLEKLYASIMSHLNNDDGRLVMDLNLSSQESRRRETGRRIVTMPVDGWGSFLEAFFKCHRSDLVEALWNDVTSLGLIPNRRMWSALVDGYGRQRNCDLAMSVWNRMLEAGIEPDETSYGAMISAYFQDRRPNEGYALFQQFRKGRMETMTGRESLTSPRMLRLFNIVLHGLCTNAMDNLARSLMKEMSEQGPKPDIVSFNTFLRHYERIGDMQGLAGILRNLRPAGVQPDVHSFTTVLSALYKAGQPDAHTKTLEIMKAMDVQPNVATYTAIIHFLVRQGGEENLRKAGELLGQMENESNKDSRPNEVTYTSLLAGIHRDTTIVPQNLKVYTAELLGRMRSQGKPPNRTTYHILIKACLENQHPVGLETALQYYHEMGKQGIKVLHDTWYVILAGLLRRGDLAVAEEIITDMSRSGHEPNSALTTLISRVQREIALRSARIL